MSTVRITQLDGKLPNLALMRLAAWHRHLGDEVVWARGISRRLGEPEYDLVYGSAIFSTSEKAVAQFRQQFPGAIVGGSGGDPALRVEDTVPTQFRGLDYSGYPRFEASIGYAMRGCRLRCKFCIVPGKEGSARAEATIAEIWRGDPYPRRLHLLDNDFFGNPDWRDRVREIVDGRFQVCINQGINVRMIGDEEAEAIVAMVPRNDAFSRRLLYAAWDNLGEERVFFDGIDRLERHGWKPQWVMAYMLIGYVRGETFEQIQYRHARMVDRGVKPYPMVHDRFRLERPEHWRRMKRFQTWAISPAQGSCEFDDFRADHRAPPIEEPPAVADLLDADRTLAIQAVIEKVDEARRAAGLPPVVRESRH